MATNNISEVLARNGLDCDLCVNARVSSSSDPHLKEVLETVARLLDEGMRAEDDVMPGTALGRFLDARAILAEVLR